MTRILTITFFLLFSVSAFCQNAYEAGKKVKSNQPATHYDRVGLTYMLLDFGTGNYYSLLKESFAKVKIVDKFDDNSVASPFMQSPVAKEATANTFAFNIKVPDQSSNKIKDALVANHTANAVIAKWFSRKPDGSFGVELLQQRGLYNATDYDVKQAGASKLGMAKLMDAGEGLLNNSFLVVYQVDDLIDMEEQYNRLQKNSKTPVTRDKNGFMATMNAYVYKIDFNDTINSIFWQQMWADPGDPKLAEKKVVFDNFNFPLTYYTRTSIMTSASQYNPKQLLAPKVQATQQELMVKMLTDGASNVIAAVETNLEEFKVKTVLFDTKPLVAKIGKKEGLKTDQRYFVFEMVQNKNGQVNAVRKGVIRATRHITDNRQMATGESKTSRFYQVAGGRLDDGMLLQQKPDAGLALSLGFGTKGIKGFDGRLDINLTKVLGANMPSMIKLYIEGGYDPTKKDITITLNDATNAFTYQNFVRYGLGFGKEFCFAHYFKLQPFAGIGLETASDKDNKEAKLSTLFGHVGVMLGLNLKHNIQLVGTLGSYGMFGKITDKDNAEVLVNGESNWKTALGRGGASNAFGIRFEF